MLPKKNYRMFNFKERVLKTPVTSFVSLICQLNSTADLKNRFRKVTINLGFLVEQENTESTANLVRSGSDWAQEALSALPLLYKDRLFDAPHCARWRTCEVGVSCRANEALVDIHRWIIKPRKNESLCD